MSSLNSFPSTTTSLPQAQDPVPYTQIQQLTEQIQKLNDRNDQQVQQLQEQDRQLTEYKNQLNDQNNQQVQQLQERDRQLTEDNNQLNDNVRKLTDQISIKRWESIKAKFLSAFALIMGTGGFMKFWIVDPMQSRSDRQKDEITQLEKQATAAKKVGGVKKTTSGQNQNSQLDLLSTLSINRVYYNFEARTVTSALVLSETSKNQLKKSPVKTVALNIEFQPGQDSVEFWIIDEQQNNKAQRLLKKEGKGNAVNTNERYFEISAGSFHKVDPSSILEIRIESRVPKESKNSKSSFAIKSLILK
jgi:hypothetical protein